MVSGFGRARMGGGGGEPDPHWADVTLLMQPTSTDYTAGSYAADETGKALAYAGNAALASDGPFTGSASIALDGSGDCLTLADDVTWDLPGNFVWEAWVKRDSAGSGSMPIIVGDSGINGNSPILNLYSRSEPGDVANKTRALTIYANGYTTGFNTGGNADAGVVPTDSWQHVAYARSGTTGRLFNGGVLAHSLTDNNSYNFARMVIGGWTLSSGAEYWRGRIAAVRITRHDRGYTGSTIPVPTDLWATF